ncbi:MICOS complex subunit MIC25 isoform X5 [Phascolarctos cinereus]
MGSTESTPRKVSFGVDEEERVRVLQGIRICILSLYPHPPPQIEEARKKKNKTKLLQLSEDVVNRMKDPSASSKVQQPSPASPPPASTSTSPPAASSLHTSPSPPSFSHSSSFVFGSPEGKSKHPRTDPKPPKAESQSSQQPSEAEEDLYRRYEQEKAMIQEELLQLVKREREVAREHLKSSLPWEKKGMNQEKQRSAQLNCEEDFLSTATTSSTMPAFLLTPGPPPRTVTQIHTLAKQEIPASALAKRSLQSCSYQPRDSPCLWARSSERSHCPGARALCSALCAMELALT